MSDDKKWWCQRVVAHHYIKSPARVNEFICIAMSTCAQVPIEGEKEGGVEWVADQAAITVQELREVNKIEI